jgi:biopolymer transport protein ExbD
LRIDAGGTVYWNETATPLSALQPMLQSELQLRADRSTRYEVIAQVMAAAQNNGLSKLGFVTEPTAAAAAAAPARK